MSWLKPSPGMEIPFQQATLPDDDWRVVLTHLRAYLVRNKLGMDAQISFEELKKFEDKELTLPCQNPCAGKDYRATYRKILAGLVKEGYLEWINAKGGVFKITPKLVAFYKQFAA